MMTTKLEKMLNIAAEKANVDVELSRFYHAVRQTLDCFKAGEELTFEEKAAAGMALKNLYLDCGLNYDYWLTKVFEE